MRVSILIPCHNAEPWIGAAIDSALRQTHPDTEVLVFDDGSTDESLTRIRSYGSQVKWTSGAKRGAPSARNRLLQRASGEWVQFLDADDTLCPDKIATQLAEAGEQIAQCDLLYSPVMEQSTSLPGGIAPAMDASSDGWVHWLQWRMGQPGGLLWRRRALEMIGGWKKNLPCCQDNELCLRALKAGLRAHFTPTPGAVCHLRSESSLSRSQPLRVIDRKTDLLDEALHWLETENLLTDNHRRVARAAFYEMARTLAKHDLGKADEYLETRRSRGLAGPQITDATPRAYALALRWLGFRNAERVARAARRWTNRRPSHA